MAFIDALIALELDSRETAPSVRLWIDADPSSGDWNEHEVALCQRGPGQWTGSFAIPDTKSVELMFRLGLITSGDGEWSLQLRDRKRGRVLLSDGDTLELIKTWVVGTCPAGASVTPARPSFGTRLRPERAPATAETGPAPGPSGSADVLQLDRYR